MTSSAILGTLIIVVVTIALGWFIERKRPVMPEGERVIAVRPPQHAPNVVGDTPATAVRVGDAQLAKLRTIQRCSSCRTEMTYDEVRDDRVRYDQRDLLVLHFACPRCQAKRTLYVEQRA